MRMLATLAALLRLLVLDVDDGDLDTDQDDGDGTGDDQGDPPGNPDDEDPVKVWEQRNRFSKKSKRLERELKEARAAIAKLEAGTGDGDDLDEDDEGDDDLRPPGLGASEAEVAKYQLAKVRREAQKRRHQLREVEAERDELKVRIEGADDALLDAAFMRAAIARGEQLDLDTLHDLMRIKGILDTVTIEEGEVVGMAEAIETAIERYPFIREYADDGDDDETRAPRRVGGRPSRKTTGDAGPDRAKIDAKFPALRGRRAGR